MKYIRTKDDIYKVILISPLGFVRADKRDGTYPDVFEKDIIKQADTIEELCDYCIYYNCYDELVIRKMPLSTSLKSLYRDMKSGMVRDIKLAILTDKGLIYVAKMNEKGELELL